MKPLSVFYSRIKPFVATCPEPTIDQALLDASIRFCEDSKVIHEVGEAFTTVATVGAYEVESPTDQRVTSIRQVWCDGIPIAPLMGDTSPAALTTTGTPTNYYGTRVGSEFLLQLYPIPDKACSITVDAAFCPTRSATQVEDDLFDLWAEAIINGALARIMSIPDQPYSNPERASGAAMSFNGLSARAKREAAFNRVEGSTTVRPRRMA